MHLSRRRMKAGGIAQRIDGGVEFRAQPAAAAPDRFSLGPLFSRLRCVDAHARWSNRSWRIHCRRRSPVPRICVARRRFCSSRSAGYGSPRNPRTAPVNRARECLPGSGTAPPRQTGDYPWLFADMSIPTGQSILDALPLVIPRSITSCHHLLALRAPIFTFNALASNRPYCGEFN
jgi:hypothetical protein